ncbi:MAG: gliding motility-associated C-terminal domain-containing protein [Dolichospermum sp.]
MLKKNTYIILLFLIKITITGNAQVLINEVLHKPGTSTSVNQGMRRKEYVEIYNAGCSPVNIGCWVVGCANRGIQTAANPAYTGAFQFPSGTIINPGQHIVVGGTQSQNSTSYPASDIDFVVANYIGTNTCDPNTNWLLPNGDGTMALYDNTGTVVDAIYWSLSSNPNIATDDDFASSPCIPSACSGITSLASARQIAATFPTRITYVGLATDYDMTFSRIPDGGAWQRDIAPSIVGANNCNGGTCISAASFTITASLTNPTCGSSNGSATITPNPAGAYTYTWTAPAVSTTNTATGLSAGPYTVTVGQGGCTTSTVITLTSTGGPTITATQTLAASCGSSDGSATVTATPGSTFTWSPSGGNLSSATNLAPGNYTVLVSLSGCNTQTVVTIPSASNSTITATQTIATSCGLSTGEATVTSIPAGATYTWSSGVSSTTNTASGLAAGNYTAYVTLAGCTISTVVTISSTGGPTITSTQTNTTTCGLSTGAATVNSTPAGTAYSWSAGVSSTTNTASGLAAGNYTAYVTLAGCTVNTVVTISSAGGPTITSVNTIGEDCNTSNGSATVTASPAGTTYLWAPSGVTTSTINGLASGNYTVTASLGACSTSSVITINPIIKTFTISPDVTILQGNSTAITVSSGYTYTWTPTTNLSCINCANPIANPSVTTNYCVDASDGVCSYTNCVIVNVEIPCIPPKILSAPNAFSPNGDGNNDEFCIKGLSNCISSFEISIFNRWGEKIYSSTEANFCWDGKYKGVSLDPGVFVYYLKAIYIDNSELTKKGNITLLH